MNGHTLLDDLIHTCEADAELILKQFAYAAQTTVAEMVDIVLFTDSVEQTDHVADRCENIIAGDVLWSKLGEALLSLSLYIALLGTHSSNDLGENTVADLVAQSDILKTVTEYSLGVYHTVGEQLELCAVYLNICLVDRARAELCEHLIVDDVSLITDKLTGDKVYGGTGKKLSAQTGLEIHLAVVLIASDSSEVIALRIEEEIVDKYLSALHKRRITGTQTLIDLLERFVYRACIILERLALHLVLCERLTQAVVVAEKLDDLLICLEAERTDKNGQGHLAVLIYADIHDIVHVGLVLDPCAAIRDDLSGINKLAALVEIMVIVHSGRADDL